MINIAREKISGVYCIENLTNRKKYIGSSKNIYNRWRDHKNALRKNKHHSYKLQRAWDKYGEQQFKFYIIKIFEGEEKELRKLEQNYLDIYKSYDFNYGYNVSCTSEGGSPSPATEQSIIDGKFKISKEQFDEIIYYLCNTKLSVPKISKIINVHKSTIYQIYFKDNYNDLVKDLTFIKRESFGENSWNSKINESQVIEIIKRLLNKEYIVDISKDYNINTSTIWDIYNHKTWIHLTENIVFPKYEKASGRTNKPINQYDLDGNFIATYKSAREVEKEIGISYKNISRYCNGIRNHKQYIFKFTC